MVSSKLIFVFGVPRSGTTLFQKLLNQHSLISAGPEFDHIPEILKLYKKLKGSLSSGRQSSYYNEASLKTLFRMFIVNLLDSAEEKVVISEKTPANTLDNATLREIFPNAKFIIILRDPRAILNSYLKVGRKARGTDLIFGMNKITSLNQIRKYLHAIHLLILGDNQTHYFFYENLVSQTELEIKKICSFLELDYEENMLFPSTNDDFQRLIDRKNVNDVPFITPYYSLPISTDRRNAWELEMSTLEKMLVRYKLGSIDFKAYKENYQLLPIPPFWRLSMWIFDFFNRVLIIPSLIRVTTIKLWKLIKTKVLQ